MHRRPDTSVLRVEECCDAGESDDIALLASLIGISRIACTLTGCDVVDEMHLTIPRPGYADRFSAALKHVRFEKPFTQLIFDSSALKLRVLSADRASMRLAREQCERLLREQGLDGGIVEHVRSLIAAPHRTLSLNEVAARLRVSPRTLKRRLNQSGSKFSELLEEERCRRARFLLSSSQIPIAEISDQLGYSNGPNFARAYRRWTGETPANFRRVARKSNVTGDLR